MDHTPFPNVKKIALFRATALGDLIFALPAIEALHKTYPEAELVYLGRAWHAAFLPGRLPGPHRVIAVPPARTSQQVSQGLVIDPDAEEDFLRRMRAELFDLGLQMHGAGEYSNPFILDCRPRFSAGLKSPRAAPLDRWIPYVYYQSETARMAEVAALVGASALDLRPCLPVLESDIQQARPSLERLRRPFVVLHPGSTDPRRCWPPEKFAAVGDACAALGLEVVLTGTQVEAERIQAVQARMQAPALNLCAQLDLSGLTGLLSRAALFVGNDFGPLHLALAAGAKAVGVFWVEYIVNSLPLLRERFYPLIAWQRTCPRCGRALDKTELDQPSASCSHEVSMVEEITPADVMRGVEVMLEGG